VLRALNYSCNVITLLIWHLFKKSQRAFAVNVIHVIKKEKQAKIKILQIIALISENAGEKETRTCWFLNMSLLVTRKHVIIYLITPFKIDCITVFSLLFNNIIMLFLYSLYFIIIIVLWHHENIFMPLNQ